jgi:hypothetical protein
MLADDIKASFDEDLLQYKDMLERAIVDRKHLRSVFFATRPEWMNGI